MARKSKALSPRRKRMSRAARLQSGRHWLRSFSGKRVVSSYARWFGVDLVCAANELQILGMHFSPEYLEAVRRTAAGHSTHGRDVPQAAEAVDVEPNWNQEFSYIAGYTDAGLPFGVTWDEMEGINDDSPLKRKTSRRKVFEARAMGGARPSTLRRAARDSTGEDLLSRAFTKLQGQYLTFIPMYTKLHRRPPAETDIPAHFQVTPPSVHNMIVMLERRGLISKAPGAPRSIRVLVEAERLPPLE
jgi:hypothetical protein